MTDWLRNTRSCSYEKIVGYHAHLSSKEGVIHWVINPYQEDGIIDTFPTEEEAMVAHIQGSFPLRSWYSDAVYVFLVNERNRLLKEYPELFV